MERGLVIPVLAFLAMGPACSGGGGSGGAGGGSGGGSGEGGGSAGCSAANCAGCCLNDACQAGNTASACGSGAIACVACEAHQVCRVDQTCGVDPNSMWRVQPASASIAPNNNGSAWDADGSPPDVQVRMTCPPPTSAMGTTPVVESYSPTWSSGGCVAKASDLLAQPWLFQVFDVDTVVDDTITGPLQYQFTEADFVQAAVSFQASGGLMSMTVDLQPQ